jgi:hypothetical protein
MRKDQQTRIIRCRHHFESYPQPLQEELQEPQGLQKPQEKRLVLKVPARIFSPLWAQK